ncbi:helix-turn-helix transcriptional regulator [Streptomyces sp. J2-1]|uniref:helix-turn-helix domain-containing protein n=1 Tax=Streptomyces corallincola TaxID=2851888 RepID=UPI001C38D87A|nr:helix-turn-helix transcriptional regulator [Streptomyces corallincola]MBV2357542.1 helix-turn-helix transcriptional regulator [Streptomyces corallincola]
MQHSPRSAPPTPHTPCPGPDRPRPTPVASRPAPASGAHFGVVLRRIQRLAGLDTAALAERTGTDRAEVEEILRGTRFPTRCFAGACARACGVDSGVLLKVWEDEHDRLHRRPRPAPDSVPTPEAAPGGAADGTATPTAP